MIIHVAVIEHMEGMEILAAYTEALLQEKIATYCRCHWETIPWKGEVLPDIPDTDSETISLYFDDHENDTLTTDITSLTR